MPDAATTRHGVLGLAIAACAMLVACQSPQAIPPRVTINVFISPAGEPFRGRADDPYPVAAWFARADSNHDGALSLEEFTADATAFFKRLDANGDGVVDGAELSAYEQKIAPEILPRVAGLTARDIPDLPATGIERQEREAEAGERASRTAAEDAQPRGLFPATNGASFYSVTGEHEPVAAADTDFDGKVSLAEAAAAARRRFAMLDKDHDGRLTRAELPKTAAERLVARSKGEEKAGHP